MVLPMPSPAVKKVFEDFRALSHEEREDFLTLFHNDDSEVAWVPTPEQQADIDRSLRAIEDGEVTSIDEFRRTFLRR